MNPIVALPPDGWPRPPYRCLRPGDTVGIVAPAGPADPELVARVPALLAAHGLRARVFPGCHLRQGYLAGPDAARLADLHAAWADPELAALWCLRGGYGSARLLPHLDTALLQQSRKLLIGYSDITALHALLDRLDCPALHAPMPASDLLRPGREADEVALFALLTGGLRAGTTWAAAPADGSLRLPGAACGRLVGGNLSLLAALAGTPWQLRTDGAILFLEDVGEQVYRVDRLLLQLDQCGALRGVRGVLLGSFTEDEDPRAVLDAALRPLGVPVLGGWPCGHGTPHRPLPLGVEVTLDADAGTLRFDEDFMC
jgi:muramoyltetrapeptide carboxypeptidase